MDEESKQSSTTETGLHEELGRLLRLGGDILRQANGQIEDHLSQRVENFKTARLDSWQELYDQLLDEYGEQAVQWKDAALQTVEDQVARLGQSACHCLMRPRVVSWWAGRRMALKTVGEAC